MNEVIETYVRIRAGYIRAKEYNYFVNADKVLSDLKELKEAINRSLE